MAGWILTSTDPDVILRLPVGTTKTVGRTPQADFILDAGLVSRVHCRLATDAKDQLIVVDLGSTNGTQVNGQPCDRSILKSGDVLTIGRVEFVVAPAP
jgi:pSer/pThr/pTyr-binding forkhead associated (FHA) protein